MIGLPWQVEPPLPAGLQVLRLENVSRISVWGVSGWRQHRRLRAAVGPELAVCAANIECSGGVSPQRSASGVQLVSKLPRGFSALEMETPDITLRLFAVEHEFTPAVAAWHLCCLFAQAPYSYRRFSVCWTGDQPLRIRVRESKTQERRRMKHCHLEPVAFDTADTFADHMRDCAVRHSMRLAVNVLKEPLQGIAIVRT